MVFLFGGSAAWGHGARDEGTIASWLAKVAEDHGEPLDVRNYAESGWVNWQGISCLTQRLAEGERPDARLADEYIADRVLVEHLGQVYGFKTLFVWQLSVADKPTLTAQERRYAGWLPRTPDTTPAIDWWAMDTESSTCTQRSAGS